MMMMMMMMMMLTWEVKAFDANTSVAASTEAKTRYWLALATHFNLKKSLFKRHLQFVIRTDNTFSKAIKSIFHFEEENKTSFG